MVLLACRTSELWGQGDFHLDFRGRAGGSCRQLLRGQCTMLQNKARGEMKTSVGDARNVDSLPRKAVGCTGSWPEREATWSAISKTVAMTPPSQPSGTHISALCPKDTGHGTTRLYIFPAAVWYCFGLIIFFPLFFLFKMSVNRALE